MNGAVVRTKCESIPKTPSTGTQPRHTGRAVHRPRTHGASSPAFLTGTPVAIGPAEGTQRQPELPVYPCH